MVNQVTGTLSDSERDSLVNGVKLLEESLKFTTVTLSADQIASLAKAGPATASFVTDGLDLAIRNPELTTGVVTPAVLKEKLTLIQNLNIVTGVVAEFQQKLENTAMLAKAEAYAHARTAYLLLKRKKATGLAEGRNRLAPRFANQGRRKNADAAPVEQTV